MCGICGGVGAAVTKSAVMRMRKALRHRGPDAVGLTHDGLCVLGHTRLAVLDLDARSNQPLSIQSGTLVYNGELWNYLSLRDRLRRQGVKFETTGDAEVLAWALAKWGPKKAMRELDGMFAFAWWDGRRLWLGRDYAGIVPLYMAKRPEGLFFASERKGLAAAGLKSAIPVPAGALIWSEDGVGLDGLQWSDLEAEVGVDLDIDSDKAVSTLRRLLRSAVKCHEIADVPICTLLSGGIDSTAITALLVEDYPDLVAFHAVLDEESRDLKAARRVAGELGIRLIEVRLKPPTLGDLSEVVRIVETPTPVQVEIGYACIGLAKAIRAEGFKVVFTGDAPDELFGSYNFFWPRRRYAREDEWAMLRTRAFVLQQERNFPRANKAFASQGVEARVPFAHRPLVEFVLGLPKDVLTRGDHYRRKGLLEDAVADVVPEYVRKRNKVAFQVGTGVRGVARDAVERSALTGGHVRRFYKREWERHYGTRA